MIGVEFRKDRAKSILDALQTGQPIAPKDSRGWHHHEMVQTAGALFFALLTHGPMQYMGNGMPNLHSEQQETVEMDLFADLHCAIEFIAQLSQMVCDEEYDGNFDPQLNFAIRQNPDDEKRALLQFVKGHRSKTNGDEWA